MVHGKPLQISLKRTLVLIIQLILIDFISIQNQVFKMKTKTAFLFFLFTFVTLSAQEKGFGAGVILGAPTGVALKYWINNSNAFAGGVAYSFFSSHTGVSLHVNYLSHAKKFKIQRQTFLPYYGFGGKTCFSEKTSLGARGVLGVSWLYKKRPVDVFLEVAPIFNLLPATDISFDVALGARYFFR